MSSLSRSQVCHSERSEESLPRLTETLSAAKGDKFVIYRVSAVCCLANHRAREPFDTACCATEHAIRTRSAHHTGRIYASET